MKILGTQTHLWDVAAQGVCRNSVSTYPASSAGTTPSSGQTVGVRTGITTASTGTRAWGSGSWTAATINTRSSKKAVFISLQNPDRANLSEGRCKERTLCENASRPSLVVHIAYQGDGIAVGIDSCTNRYRTVTEETCRCTHVNT